MKWGFPNRRVYWTPLEESRLAPRPGLESGAHYKLARAATRVRFVERNFASSLGLPAIPIQVLKGLTIPWLSAVSCLGVAAAVARKVLHPPPWAGAGSAPATGTQLLAVSALRARTATSSPGPCRCTAGRLPCASSLKNCCCWAT
ncbi:uncharacterized protein SMIM47 isoform X1 [Chlorocebus sabaeus]|uniref:uncharacterized protein SMIM47 isoform X1 n=1 Tax=Chlorocebus sabaeus TaxID=60711 RepID=UPI003BF9B11D